MRIHGQIEDHNKAWFYVLRKRNTPKVGDKITVSMYPFSTPFGQSRCEVVDIEELPNGQLFRLRRIEEE